MYNIFHRLSKRELEDAIIQWLASTGQRDDLVTVLINNECGFSLSDMNSHHNVKKAINNIPFDNVIVMDLIENYCPNNFCPAVSNGEVRYSDHHHLSKQYMKEISPLIDEKLVRIFSNLPQ